MPGTVDFELRSVRDYKPTGKIEAATCRALTERVCCLGLKDAMLQEGL